MTDKIIFLNTQGFLNKYEQLNQIVLAYKPIVLLIAEHFQDDKSKLDKIVGYRLCAVFCRESREKGGVAVYVRIDIAYVERPDLDAHNEKKLFEIASVEIPERALVVTAAYRSPSSSKVSFNSKLERFLDICNQESENFHLIAGDFNIDNTKANSTEKVLEKHRFRFLLSTQTHDYGACLDNFIVDFEHSRTRVLRSKVGQLSDHRPIELILPSTRQKLKFCIDPWTSYRSSNCEEESEKSSDDESLKEYSIVSGRYSQSIDRLSDLLDGFSVGKNSSGREQTVGKGRGRGRVLGRRRGRGKGVETENGKVDPWRSYRSSHCEEESDKSSDDESLKEYSIVSESYRQSVDRLSDLLDGLSVEKNSNGREQTVGKGRGRGRGRGKERGKGRGTQKQTQLK